jgi:hypothetical protein
MQHVKFIKKQFNFGSLGVEGHDMVISLEYQEVSGQLHWPINQRLYSLWVMAASMCFFAKLGIHVCYMCQYVFMYLECFGTVAMSNV